MIPNPLVLGSWVKPCGTRLGIRKGEKGAIRLPKILVLIRPNPSRIAAAEQVKLALSTKEEALISVALGEAGDEEGAGERFEMRVTRRECLCS